MNSSSILFCCVDFISSLFAGVISAYKLYPVYGEYQPSKLSLLKVFTQLGQKSRLDREPRAQTEWSCVETLRTDAAASLQEFIHRHWYCVVHAEVFLAFLLGSMKYERVLGFYCWLVSISSYPVFPSDFWSISPNISSSAHIARCQRLEALFSVRFFNPDYRQKRKVALLSGSATIKSSVAYFEKKSALGHNKRQRSQLGNSAKVGISY